MAASLDVTRYLPSRRDIEARATDALRLALRKQDEDVDETSQALLKVGAALAASAGGSDLPADDGTAGLPLVQEPPGSEPLTSLPTASDLVQEPPGSEALALPRATSLALPRATAESPKPSSDWRRVVAGIADGLSGGKTNYLGALNAREREARLAARDERLAAQEDRLYGLKVVETFSKLTTEQTTNFKNTLADLGEWSKRANLATEDERVEAANLFRERFRAVGVEVPQGFVNAMVRVPKVAEMAGVFAPFLDSPQRAGQYAAVVNEMYSRGASKEIVPFLEGQITPYVRHEAGQVFTNIARELKKLPEYEKGDVPFETVLGVMRAIPDKGAAYALALQNQLGRRESYADWLDTVDFRGVERPDITAAARKAGAVKGAERAAEIATEMPRLEPGVLAELARAKVDPRTATQEQIGAATRASEDRTIAFDRRKALALQAIEGQKPLTEDQRNRLRLDYREEARRVVLSTEPGGIFGSMDKLEPEQKRDLETRIDAKAVEMATADGLGTLFARAARPAAAPAPAPTLRWDQKKKILVPAR